MTEKKEGPRERVQKFLKDVTGKDDALFVDFKAEPGVDLVEQLTDGRRRITGADFVAMYNRLRALEARVADTEKLAGSDTGSVGTLVGFRYDYYSQGWDEAYTAVLVRGTADFEEACEAVRRTKGYDNARDFTNLSIDYVPVVDK